MKNVIKMVITMVAVVIMNGCGSETTKNTIDANIVLENRGHIVLSDNNEFDALKRLNEMYDDTDSVLESGLVEVGTNRANMNDIMALDNMLSKHNYMLDIDNYGKLDKWMILTGVENGDCEDLSFTALVFLLERGIDPKSLTIELGLWDGKGHAMLRMEMDNGEIIYSSTNDLLFINNKNIDQFENQWNKISTAVYR